MKKTFLAKRNALLSRRNISWGVFSFACAVGILGVRILAPDFFLLAVRPAFQASDALAGAGHAFLGNFSDAAKIAATNEKVTLENETLATENQALVQKVADLTALLGATPAVRGGAGILAGVVERPPVSPYDTIVIAAGSKDGAQLGMEAFGTSGTPVGVVSSVLDDFSRVTLFSAPGASTGGWVGHSAAPVTLLGAGAGVLQATISRDASIAVGDTVFVPGPGQLPIGSVVRIDSDPLSPGVTLRIKPAVNPFSLSWVMLRQTGIAGVSFATSTPL